MDGLAWLIETWRFYNTEVDFSCNPVSDSRAPSCPPWKAFITAWFYHTPQASWVGLLVGAVIFQSCAVSWICSYKQDESEAKEHSDEYAKMHDVQENRSSGSKK